jgi:hypothetical protein
VKVRHLVVGLDSMILISDLWIWLRFRFVSYTMLAHAVVPSHIYFMSEVIEILLRRDDGLCEYAAKSVARIARLCKRDTGLQAILASSDRFVIIVSPKAVHEAIRRFESNRYHLTRYRARSGTIRVNLVFNLADERDRQGTRPALGPG